MKLRIATKNFLCEKCNNLISKNEQYFDWWNTRLDGSYYHKRFHLTCMNKTPTVSKPTITTKSKPTIFDRILKLIEQENGCLPASNNGIKCYICGIHYDEAGNKCFLCETWGDRKPYYESAEIVRTKYHDYKGDYF